MGSAGNVVQHKACIRHKLWMLRIVRKTDGDRASACTGKKAGVDTTFDLQFTFLWYTDEEALQDRVLQCLVRGLQTFGQILVGLH